jgi:transposase
VLDGAINGAAFLAYTEQFMASTLAPGDIVVLDNLSSHKVSGVREAIEARGAALLYLPACSPDLNPIELAFSKLKRLRFSRACRAPRLIAAPCLTKGASCRQRGHPVVATHGPPDPRSGPPA